MHATTTGTGKPLLLVHGISNLHNWDLVVPPLAQHRTVYAVDLPGFGESAPLDHEVTIATLTDAVERFIADAKEAGVDGLILVSAGAGGHAGDTNPFALVASIRPWFDGLVLLAGWQGYEAVAGHRDEDGGYWTGYVWPDEAVWPQEKPMRLPSW